MKQFEYEIVALDGDNISLDALNKMGEKGWELVWIRPWTSSRHDPEELPEHKVFSIWKREKTT